MPTICQTLESFLLSPMPEVTHPRLQIVNYIEMYVKSIAALHSCWHSWTILYHPSTGAKPSLCFSQSKWYLYSLLQLNEQGAIGRGTKDCHLQCCQAGSLGNTRFVQLTTVLRLRAGHQPFRFRPPDFVSRDRCISFHLSELKVNSLANF